jgi:hypothetical protein
MFLMLSVFAPLAGVCIREKPKAKKKPAKARPTVRAYKKKKPKKAKQYKAPKLSSAQHAILEKYWAGRDGVQHQPFAGGVPA